MSEPLKVALTALNAASREDIELRGLLAKLLEGDAKATHKTLTFPLGEWPRCNYQNASVDHLRALIEHRFLPGSAEAVEANRVRRAVAQALEHTYGQDIPQDLPVAGLFDSLDIVEIEMTLEELMDVELHDYVQQFFYTLRTTRPDASVSDAVEQLAAAVQRKIQP